MNDENNIVFINDKINGKFNFRVSAIIQSSNKLLVQESIENDHYFLIGGRVSFFESAEDAIIREIEEEVNVKLTKEDIKLIDIVENFYEFKNRNVHELLFIYKVIKIDEFLNIDNMEVLDNSNIINKWVNIDDIFKKGIVPSNIKNILNNDTLTHEVIRD